MTPRNTSRILHRMIIGASRSPTPYKIKTPTEQYVRCGADILLNAVEHDLEGESRCIICGNPTLIKTVRGKIVQVNPPEALLHVVEIQGEHGARQIVCEGSPICDRRVCLEKWLKSYNGLPGQVFELQEYMPHASRLVAERVGPAPAKISNEMNVPSTRVIRCADCGCSPAECEASISALDCPNCSLESCCCMIPSPAA